MNKSSHRACRSTIQIEPLESRIAPAAVLHLLSDNIGNGDTADGSSHPSAFSADGKSLLFISHASNLTPGEIDGVYNTFVKNLETGDVHRIGLAPDGSQGIVSGYFSSGAAFAGMSADGKLVTFTSWASNLVPDDTNGEADIFVENLETGVIQRVSTASDGTQANRGGVYSMISDNGRFVAFTSRSNNLAPGDVDFGYYEGYGTDDIFVKDLQTGVIIRVNTDSNGASGGYSEYGGFSAPGFVVGDNGNVVFSTDTSNLVPGDTDEDYDVFVKNALTGVTSRVNTAFDGTAGNGYAWAWSLSADGNIVVFTTAADNLVPGDTNGVDDIFVKNLETGAIQRVSTASDGTEANGDFVPSVVMSAQGNTIAFVSNATNLVPGGTDGKLNIYVKQLDTGVTRLVGPADEGDPNSGYSYGDDQLALSHNGNLLTYHTVDYSDYSSKIFAFNILTGEQSWVNININGLPGNARDFLSGSRALPNRDGTLVAFSSASTDLTEDRDYNGGLDIFLRNLAAGTTTLVTKPTFPTISNTGNGYSEPEVVSPNGRFVGFYSEASNLIPNNPGGGPSIFVKDLWTGKTIAVDSASDGTMGNSGWTIFPFHPRISDDGNVAFGSYSSNLVPGDTNGRTDTFVKNVLTGITIRVSTASDGTEGSGGSPDGGSFDPVMSADGKTVVFLSDETNLVPGDTNETFDLFVKNLETGAIQRVSTASDGSQADGPSNSAALSPDGKFLAFDSFASNLVPGDTNGSLDVFVKNLETGEIQRVSTATDGTEANFGSYWNVQMSENGRFVGFSSFSDNLVEGDTNETADIFVKDLQTGVTTRANTDSNGVQIVGGYGTYYLQLANNGNVLFSSDASNLVAGDTNEWQDIFVKNVLTGVTTRVSTASDGTQANSGSDHPMMSTDGRIVVFSSFASNLVPGDTNGNDDVFMKNLETGAFQRVSTNGDGIPGNSRSDYPKLSADGNTIAFMSYSTNWEPNDKNRDSDAFALVFNPNVAPELGAVTEQTAEEGTPISISLNFTDTDGVGAHKALIKWGDGTESVGTVIAPAAGQPGKVLGDHVYADDGNYTVSVQVTDHWFVSDIESFPVTVANVAPTLFPSSLTNTAIEVGTREQQAVNVSIAFSDLGFGTETFALSRIDWGDGTPAQSAILGSIADGTAGTPTTGTLSGTHEYAAGGVYTVTIFVTDDDGGEATLQTQAIVTGVGMHNGALVIIGANGDDDVKVTQADGSIQVKGTLGGMAVSRTYAAAGVSFFAALLFGGKDRMSVQNKLEKQLFVDGGVGDDRLEAGGGSAVLLGDAGVDELLGSSVADWLDGGTGDDRIFGLDGDDCLLGGEGADQLFGGRGDDILDGGAGSDSLDGGIGTDRLVSDGSTDRLVSAKEDVAVSSVEDALVTALQSFHTSAGWNPSMLSRDFVASLCQRS